MSNSYSRQQAEMIRQQTDKRKEGNRQYWNVNQLESNNFARNTLESEAKPCYYYSLSRRRYKTLRAQGHVIIVSYLETYILAKRPQAI